MRRKINSRKQANCLPVCIRIEGGKTQRGYLNALARLPRKVFKAVQPMLRCRIEKILHQHQQWIHKGWIPLGCDGSRLALPRDAELERRFGTSGTGDFPQMWLTRLVHLPTGVPWCWRLGRSDASERHHLCHLAETVPERGLVVADTVFTGYEVWNKLNEHGRHFVIRLSSAVQLYADYEVKEDFEEGRVLLWPKNQPHKKPMHLRLVRLPAKGTAKHDVWLITTDSCAMNVKFFRSAIRPGQKRIGPNEASVASG
jgi:hypothetical protein